MQQQRNLCRATRLNQFQARNSAEYGDIVHSLVRVSRSTRQRAGERPNIDDLRAFRCIVVNLLHRARNEKTCEGMHHRDQSLQSHTARL
jgi:hypothetical protein